MLPVHVAFPRPRQPANSCPCHHCRYLVAANFDTQTINKFCVDTANSITSTRSTMNIGNSLGQHRMTNGPLTPPPVGPRPPTPLSHPQYSARGFRAYALPGPESHPRAL